MIATGLLAPFAEGAEDNPVMMEMALARLDNFRRMKLAIP